MAGEAISANMLLPIPGVGITSGPVYAQDLNNCLTIIDSHDHSSGSGVPITPSGLNISSDLTFINNNLTNVRSMRFESQSAALGGATDLGCIYEIGVDLYFNDGSGNVVRLTQNGAVAGTPGSIANLVSPASASYSSSNSSFIFQSNVNTPADLDGASLKLRNLTANSHALTLSPPNAMGADYSIVLPALPVVSSVTTIDTAGNMGTAPYNVVNQVGFAVAYTGSSIPSGYLLCDGSAVSRTTYAALFAVIGTTYGVGDGSTTFNLPDATGKLSFNKASATPPSYLQSYWHMDSVGGEPNEIQPSGYDLSEAGTVPTVPGILDDARGQYSVSNYLFWPASSSNTTVFDISVFAVDAWVKFTGATSYGIISKMNSAETGGWDVRTNASGQIVFVTAGGTTLTSATSYNDGNWHYVYAAQIATSGSNNKRLYVDGVLVGQATGAVISSFATQDLVLGALPSVASPLAGLIDDVSFWNTMPVSWSTVEDIIADRWNGGVGNLYTSLISVPVNYIIKT